MGDAGALDMDLLQWCVRPYNNCKEQGTARNRILVSCLEQAQTYVRTMKPCMQKKDVYAYLVDLTAAVCAQPNVETQQSLCWLAQHMDNAYARYEKFSNCTTHVIRALLRHGERSVVFGPLYMALSADSASQFSQYVCTWVHEHMDKCPTMALDVLHVVFEKMFERTLNVNDGEVWMQALHDMVSVIPAELRTALGGTIDTILEKLRLSTHDVEACAAIQRLIEREADDDVFVDADGGIAEHLRGGSGGGGGEIVRTCLKLAEASEPGQAAVIRRRLEALARHCGGGGLPASAPASASASASASAQDVYRLSSTYSLLFATSAK